VTAYLLDTNVVSELRKRQADSHVVAWMSRQLAGDLFLSAISLGELVRGAHLLAPGRRRAEIERWIAEDLARAFASRILPFDREDAVVWGELTARRERAGRKLPAVDGQIAAIAIRHRLTVATRNVMDFTDLALAAVNPWTA
jgi:predicted nucleic acid-binding protein